MLAAYQSNKRRISVLQLTLDFDSLRREGSRMPHPAGVLDAREQEDSDSYQTPKG